MPKSMAELGNGDIRNLRQQRAMCPLFQLSHLLFLVVIGNTMPNVGAKICIPIWCCLFLPEDNKITKQVLNSYWSTDRLRFGSSSDILNPTSHGLPVAGGPDE